MSLRPPTHARAFSLIELAMVCATIAILGAIAAPRFAAAQANARASALKGNLSTFQRAVDRFMEEHLGRGPASSAEGEIDADERRFVSRLVRRSDDEGNPKKDGLWGPYLRDLPTNPLARCVHVRIDTKDTVEGCAWRFDPETNTVYADHLVSGACMHTPADQVKPAEPTVPDAGRAVALEGAEVEPDK